MLRRNMSASDAGAPAPPGLASRRLALRWIDGVLVAGRPFDASDASDAGPEAGDALAARDRAFARLLAATALRRLGQIDDLIDRCLRAPLSPRVAAARGALRLGAAQLAFLDTPPHAAVDTAVRLAPPRARGLVNAVLRRIAREGAVRRAAQDAERLNTPGWLWRSWRAAYGAAQARAIAAAHLVAPPLDLSPRGDPAAVAEAVDGAVLETGTVRRAAGGRIEALPGFADGEWWVQDAAAALPARLLGAGPGDEAVELCAAPGGKTAQLAAMGVRVTAVDSDSSRLELLAAAMRRLRLEARAIRADARRWRPGAPARFVLLDAPCTTTGTIRRRPDVPRLKRPGDVAAARAVQDRLLDNAAAMLAPGGALVYAVCSLQPEEGPQAVAALLARDPTLALDPVRAAEVGGFGELLAADGALRSLPCHLADRGGVDGFYAARLKRRGGALP